MRNGASSPLRTIVRGWSGLFTTATTVMNPRVSRGLVLQVSLLLLCRAILELLPISLTGMLGDTVFPMMLNVFQSTIVLSTVSAYIGTDGWLGALGRRILSPVDNAFVHLYACLVLIAGPLFAVAECVVVVFESMRVARNLENRMQGANGGVWRSVILYSTVGLYGCVCGIAFLVYRLLGGGSAIQLPIVVLIWSVLYFIISFASETANVLEAAFLSAYSSLVVLAGCVEELDVRKSHILALVSNNFEPPTPEVRAFLLVASTAVALIALPRVSKVARTILFSHEFAEAEDDIGTSAAPAAPAMIVPPLALGSAGIGPNAAPYVVAPPTGSKRNGLMLGAAIAVVTFRVLVWSGTLRAGEYYAMQTRGAQLVITLIVYCLFLKIESEDDEQKQDVRAANAAYHSKAH